VPPPDPIEQPGPLDRRPPARSVGVGLLGVGTVGSAIAAQLVARGADIEGRTGVRPRVVAAAVRDLSKPRPSLPDDVRIAPDPLAVVADPEVQLVVELMGGIEPARTAILAALRSGKPVVTANKELIAAHGPELFEAADASGVDLLFEAAVGGGIPIIRPLRESLVGERIETVMGIVNGTTNFILTKMTEEGADYGEVLAEAQALGYAEADPAADVGGHDAASKAAILASIAFGVHIASADVAREGIQAISAQNVVDARKLGFVIKLLAIAERTPAGIAVRVHPAMVPVTHPLASVRGAFNAVFVEGADVGQLMFYGRGAGGGPTASAVLGDVIDAAVNLVKGTHATLGGLAPATIVPLEDCSTAFCLVLEVNDRPGVLAAVAKVFGDHGISIRSMEQQGLAGSARLVFVTHLAREQAVRRCLAELGRLDPVRRVGSVLRVVGVQ
jgi:homoserine dehydrogenase